GAAAGRYRTQRRPPRSASIDPMAGHAVGVVEALGVAGARRRLGIIEKPGQRSGEGPDDHEGGEEAEQGPAHGWQDTTRALTSAAPTARGLAQRSVGGGRGTTWGRRGR